MFVEVGERRKRRVGHVAVVVWWDGLYMNEVEGVLG